MAIATMYNFFSLGWVVTLACIQGLVQREGVFLRTPKATKSSKAWHAIQVTQWETAISITSVLVGILAFGFDRNWRTFALCILLIWQGSLYLAAPLYSLLSLRREAAMGVQARVTEQGKPMLEQLAARWVMVFSMVLIGTFGLIRFLPAPSGLPDYARFLPIDLSPEQIVGHQPAGTSFVTAPTLPPTVAQDPEITATAIATLPSTASGIATIKVDSANCREKPKGGADRVVYLYRGQKVEVLGRNEDARNPWWYVKIPDASGYCWVWSLTTTMTGNIEEIPIVK